MVRLTRQNLSAPGLGLDQIALTQPLLRPDQPVIDEG